MKQRKEMSSGVLEKIGGGRNQIYRNDKDTLGGVDLRIEDSNKYIGTNIHSTVKEHTNSEH